MSTVSDPMAPVPPTAQVRDVMSPAAPALNIAFEPFFNTATTQPVVLSPMMQTSATPQVVFQWSSANGGSGVPLISASPNAASTSHSSHYHHPAGSAVVETTIISSSSPVNVEHSPVAGLLENSRFFQTIPSVVSTPSAITPALREQLTRQLETLHEAFQEGRLEPREYHDKVLQVVMQLHHSPLLASQQVITSTPISNVPLVFVSQAPLTAGSPVAFYPSTPGSVLGGTVQVTGRGQLSPSSGTSVTVNSEKSVSPLEIPGASISIIELLATLKMLIRLPTSVPDSQMLTTLFVLLLPDLAKAMTEQLSTSEQVVEASADLSLEDLAKRRGEDARTVSVFLGLFARRMYKTLKGLKIKGLRSKHNRLRVLGTESMTRKWKMRKLLLFVAGLFEAMSKELCLREKFWIADAIIQKLVEVAGAKEAALLFVKALDLIFPESRNLEAFQRLPRRILNFNDKVGCSRCNQVPLGFRFRFNDGVTSPDTRPVCASCLHKGFLSVRPSAAPLVPVRRSSFFWCEIPTTVVAPDLGSPSLHSFALGSGGGVRPCGDGHQPKSVPPTRVTVRPKESTPQPSAPPKGESPKRAVAKTAVRSQRILIEDEDPDSDVSSSDSRSEMPVDPSMGKFAEVIMTRTVNISSDEETREKGIGSSTIKKEKRKKDTKDVPVNVIVSDKASPKRTRTTTIQKTTEKIITSSRPSKEVKKRKRIGRPLASQNVPEDALKPSVYATLSSRPSTEAQPLRTVSSSGSEREGPRPATVKPTAAKPTAAKPTTAKPTAAKPTTVKPATPGPFIEAKPTPPLRRLVTSSSEDNNSQPSKVAKQIPLVAARPVRGVSISSNEGQSPKASSRPAVETIQVARAPPQPQRLISSSSSDANRPIGFGSRPQIVQTQPSQPSKPLSITSSSEEELPRPPSFSSRPPAIEKQLSQGLPSKPLSALSTSSSEDEAPKPTTFPSKGVTQPRTISSSSNRDASFQRQPSSSRPPSEGASKQAPQPTRLISITSSEDEASRPQPSNSSSAGEPLKPPMLVQARSIPTNEKAAQTPSSSRPPILAQSFQKASEQPSMSSGERAPAPREPLGRDLRSLSLSSSSEASIKEAHQAVLSESDDGHENQLNSRPPNAAAPSEEIPATPVASFRGIEDLAGKTSSPIERNEVGQTPEQGFEGGELEKEGQDVSIRLSPPTGPGSDEARAASSGELSDTSSEPGDELTPFNRSPAPTAQPPASPALSGLSGVEQTSAVTTSSPSVKEAQPEGNPIQEDSRPQMEENMEVIFSSSDDEESDSVSDSDEEDSSTDKRKALNRPLVSADLSSTSTDSRSGHPFLPQSPAPLYLGLPGIYPGSKSSRSGVIESNRSRMTESSTYGATINLTATNNKGDSVFQPKSKNIRQFSGSSQHSNTIEQSFYQSSPAKLTKSVPSKGRIVSMTPVEPRKLTAGNRLVAPKQRATANGVPTFAASLPGRRSRALADGNDRHGVMRF